MSFFLQTRNHFSFMYLFLLLCGFGLIRSSNVVPRGDPILEFATAVLPLSCDILSVKSKSQWRCCSKINTYASCICTSCAFVPFCEGLENQPYNSTYCCESRLLSCCERYSASSSSCDTYRYTRVCPAVCGTCAEMTVNARIVDSNTTTQVTQSCTRDEACLARLATLIPNTTVPCYSVNGRITFNPNSASHQMRVDRFLWIFVLMVWGRV